MRAKQSTTAKMLGSCSESITQFPPIHAAAPNVPSGCVSRTGRALLMSGLSSDSVGLQSGSLRHDARNLMGALRLYCDLLSMPDVLKPEHRHYADELRLLNTRSEALIEHLIQLLSQERVHGLAEDTSSKGAAIESSFGTGARIAEVDAVGSLVSPVKPVSWRRPAAASTKEDRDRKRIREASAPDCPSCPVPEQLGIMPKVRGAWGKLSPAGLPDAVESSATDSKSKSKHPEDSKPGVEGLVSC